MIHYLTVWGSNSNEELNIPERLGQTVGLNSNLISGYRNVSKFYLGYRHGIASKPSSQIYARPLYSGNIITGYDQIVIPVNTSWGDNTFFQLAINRTIGNLTFYYDKFDLGNDTTYAIDAQLGLIHGFGFDLIFSDLFDATGQIVNWTFADLNLNGIPPGNLALYPRGYIDVKAGNGYVLALNSGNKITGWGNSGNPVISGRRYTGLNPLGTIKQITAGQSHALVLFNNGLISGWGDNSLGQLNFDTGILYSGVKISTKNNHNLALGFAPPTIINITGSGTTGVFNIRNLGYLNKNKNISGLDIQYSLNRKEWISHLFNTDLIFKPNTLFTGTNLLSGNENYYIRLVEYYNTFCENTGWKQIVLGNTNIGFRSVDMSSNGQYQTFVGVSGGRSYPFISNNYGNTWTQVTGVTGSFFWNDYVVGVKISTGGNLQLIAGPRSSTFSGPYGVYLSQNYGNTWSLLTANNSNLSYLDASDDLKVIAIPKLINNFISISHNSGVTWFDATGAGARSNWRQISLSSDGRYMLASVNETNQALFKSSNSGISWGSTSGILSGGFTAVKISKNGQIQLAGATSFGSLFISYDYGNTWSTSISTPKSWLNIDMSDDAKYILASTNESNIYRSQDSGLSWNQIDLVSIYGENPVIGQMAISSNGEYQTMIRRPITAGDTNKLYSNCNFGLNALSGNILNTGSTVIHNPFNKKFDIWSDYRVYGWGDSEFGIENIPEKIKNERIIDIAAGFNNNLILTENPVAEFESKVGITELEFLDSNVLVSGAGINLFNKTFLLDGEANGRPLYRYYSGVPARPSNISIFWDTTRWGLYSGVINLIYYSEDNVDYPWLGSWTSDNFNYFPVPAILELSSFIEETPPPCTGFIFDVA
jgi:hypothetical protein